MGLRKGGGQKWQRGKKWEGKRRQEKERAKLAGTSRQQGPAAATLLPGSTACDLMAGAWGWGDGGRGACKTLESLFM